MVPTAHSLAIRCPKGFLISLLQPGSNTAIARGASAYSLFGPNEFDQLYEEAGTRRRQMSISAHDRIGGTPGVVKALSEFLKYASSHKGVWFARKDEIAKSALQTPDITLRVEQAIA